MLRSLHLFVCGAAFASLAPGVSVSKADQPNDMETIVVTATREAKSRSDVAESIDVMSSTDIENISPTHPSQVLNRIPGVHINNLGGEGHMTAIR
jgi:iron complex outermembrane recepter protein